jgi:Raf kinase inhibitor-like YbhB/YbcL family protein
MELTSSSFDHGEMIPDEFAFATPHDETRVTFSTNRNPHLAWADVPAATRSFVVMCVDSDVPTKPDDVNQEGREVPPDLPRTEFVHWVAVDLPPDLREIPEGEFASGVVPGGQDTTFGPYGCRQGVNDYTGWFSGDPDMDGTYVGYDGPGPPWNDSLVHNYAFTVYALDVDRLAVVGAFTADEVERAMRDHILDQATLTGQYTLNARLR